MSNNESPSLAAAPDVVALFRRVIAHWPVVFATLALGALVTLRVVQVRRATFRSEAVIVYHAGVEKALGASGGPDDSIRTLGSRLKETLLAQKTLRGVIDEMHLYPDIVTAAGHAAAVEQMRRRVEIKSRSQDTFAIAFEGSDRDEAQKVCTRLADVLIADGARRAEADAHRTVAFLDAQMQQAEAELTAAERASSELFQAHPELAAGGGLGTEAILAQKAAEERRKQGRPAPPAARERPSPGAAPGAADRPPPIDPVLLAEHAQAKADVAAATKALAEVSQKYTDEHPAVIEARAALAAAQAALRRAQEAVAAALARESRPAETPADPYADPHPRPAAAAVAAPREPMAPVAPADKVALETQATQLSRTLSLVKGHHADLETRLYHARMVEIAAGAGLGAGLTVLDPAYRPSVPSNAPNRIVAGIGLLASLAVGVLLSAAWGLFLDDRLFSANEVEGVVAVPVLGAVPRSSRRRARA
jgi:uncharacterized protein involved in exopolysaccharide biosynthesis